MAFISKSSVSEINARIDAVSIIGDYVRLEKKSGRWWGKCPFHAGGNEKTPSFKVDPDLKMYHCFGCNKGGSVISFIMEMDGLTYPEALKNLARKMGIELTYEESGAPDNEMKDSAIKEQLYELYERTTKTFSYFLTEKPEGRDALEYLAGRGINNDMISSFKLGYAPSDKNFLYNFLKQKGYSGEFLEKSGLFSKNYKTLPLFSSRLMFPITDRQGRITAFSGRILANEDAVKDAPKYINSPETAIYKKGQTLYGIDAAKNEIRKTKTAVLAEGNLDVIALHQAGITNAAAPLGTAFTDEQAEWLGRWAEKALLFFDNDAAGVKAGFKAILTCRKHGISCYVANLEKARMAGGDAAHPKDPAEILQKFGEETLKNTLNFIILDFEYLISLTKDVSRIPEYLFPYLDVLSSDIERDDSIAKIADYFRVDKKAVQNDYKERKRKSYSNRREDGAQTGNKEPRYTAKRNFELLTIAAAALNFELYPDLRKAVEISQIDDLAAKELFIVMEECFANGEKDIDSLLLRIKEESLKSFIIAAGTSHEFKGKNARQLMEGGIKEIRKKKILKRLMEIGAELRQLEKNADKEHAQNPINDLLDEKMRLDEQIRNLEGK